MIASIAVVAALPVAAETYGGGSVTGYSADKTYDYGTVVQLSSKSSSSIKIATQAELQNMFGVVVDPNQIPLTITNEGVQNETFVAVSGTYNVLVSTQAGAIATGDFVTLSSVNGVTMKAGTEEKSVLGRANAAFNTKSTKLSTTTLKDSNGGPDKVVSIGFIPVTINIQHNPNKKSTKADVPDILQRIGLAVAEKEVSPLRIYLSLGILAISAVAAFAIVYAGVRNGVISIGRNPMSRKSIFRALIEVILTSIVILVIGLFAVYLLLKL